MCSRPDAPCPVCGDERSALAQGDPRDFEYGDAPGGQPWPPFRYLRCLPCGSEYLSPRPSPAELSAFYPPDYGAWVEGRGPLTRALAALRALARALHYRRLLRHRPGRLFDVGPGRGAHLDEMRRYAPLECAGVEMHPELAAQARARGHAVQTGTLEDLDTRPWAGSFDIVSMNHVLEHVVDPECALERAWELLRPGGALVGQLPAVDCWERRLFGRAWGGYHFPRHLQAFSRRGLRHTLGRARFAEVRMGGVPHLQAAVSVQNWLVGRGLRLHLRAGRCRGYGALLVGVAPFEVAAWLTGGAGVIGFEARKPDPGRPSPPRP